MPLDLDSVSKAEKAIGEVREFWSGLEGDGWSEVEQFEFWLHAGEGNLEGVERLLDGGVDVDCGDGIALCVAAGLGREDVGRYLLEKGAEADRGESRALRWAAEGGHVRMAESLLEHGADVNAAAGGPLLNAVCSGSLEMVEFLLERGADVNKNTGVALGRALDNYDAEILEALLAQGGVNFETWWNAAVDATFLDKRVYLKLLLDYTGDVATACRFLLPVAYVLENWGAVKLLFEGSKYEGAVPAAADLEIYLKVLDDLPPAG